LIILFDKINDSKICSYKIIIQKNNVLIEGENTSQYLSKVLLTIIASPGMKKVNE